MERVYENRLTQVQRETYGRQVAQARQTYQISQKGLAAKMKCHREQISMAEHGFYRRKDFYIRAISAVMEIVAERTANQNQRLIATMLQSIGA